MTLKSSELEYAFEGLKKTLRIIDLELILSTRLEVVSLRMWIIRVLVSTYWIECQFDGQNMKAKKLNKLKSRVNTSLQCNTIFFECNQEKNLKIIIHTFIQHKKYFS